MNMQQKQSAAPTAKTDPVWAASVAAMVIAAIAAFASVAIFSPPDTLNKIGNAIGRMPDLVRWITEASIAVGALAGAIAALRNRVRQGAAPATTPSDPGGPPLTILLAFGIGGAIGIGTLGTGCGSTFQTHMTAIDAAAQVTAVGSEAAHAAALREAETRCPMPGRAEREACVAPLRDAWAPVDVAVDGTKLALAGWLETAALARSSGDWSAAPAALGRLVVAWERLTAVLREHGVEIPPLPEPVLVLARAVGGGS